MHRVLSPEQQVIVLWICTSAKEMYILDETFWHVSTYISSVSLDKAYIFLCIPELNGEALGPLSDFNCCLCCYWADLLSLCLS